MLTKNMRSDGPSLSMQDSWTSQPPRLRPEPAQPGQLLRFLKALAAMLTSAQPASLASMHLPVEELLNGGQLPMALRPPGNILPEVPGAATAEGVHPPVDMHQVGDLVPGKGKIQP